MKKTGFLLLVALISGLVWSCTKTEEPEPLPEAEPIEEADTGSYTFLALGDSYTIGEGVAETLRWPNQLGQRLNDFGKTISEINIIAQTGWRTSSLIEAIEIQQPKDHDLVSLLIGVNNQFSGSPFGQFQADFDTLINIASSLANGKDNIFVVSIPDYGVTPFGAFFIDDHEISVDDYNAYIEQRCAELNIRFINITDISRELGDGENALAPDNLHPSGYQYSLWVEEILPVVLEILE